MESSETKENYSYAGFWIRFAAIILDGLIVTLAYMPISAIIEMYKESLPVQKANPTIDLIDKIDFGLQLIFDIVYYTYFHASKYQATLGKRAVGIYVINSEGKRLSCLNSFGRHLAGLLSAVTLCIGFMMAGWTKKKQALHDMVAGTYVVYGKPGGSIIEAEKFLSGHLES